MLVLLREPARHDPRAEHRATRMRHAHERRTDVVTWPFAGVGLGAAAGEQPQEVRLARAVRAEHRDPVAVPDLEVERLHEARELEPLAHDRALAGARAAQPHRHRLRRRALLGRAGLLELAQARTAAW